MNVESPGARAIFLEAVGRREPRERSRYLDEACAGDPSLRGRVEALLRAHAESAGLLDDLGRAPGLTADFSADSGCVGTSIGPYKLLEQIGEGGMGVVYVAEQVEPVRRRVALKVIRPGMASRQVVARFEAERQALAMMDHPNIAKVHDGGATDSGRPFFVMELVRGVPITDYCDGAKLPLAGRLELFVLVCRAVQHAHQKGVIHRDLKPSNILVTLHDGMPVPKVIDFGIAKATGRALTEKTVYTAFAQLVGTPLYMSPEQVEMSGLDVDTRSDIYSLGVLLYELLTGTTPFDRDTIGRAAFDEVRRILREQEPPRPSARLSGLGATRATISANRGSDARQLNRDVRGELDWVVMKALEKDRRRRYETANDFAADIRRYLTDRPVEACPPSAWYRFSKGARRNRAALVTAAIVATALVLGTTVSTWQAIVASEAKALARDQLAQAEKQRDSADENLYLAHMRLARQDWAAGNVRRMLDLLEGHRPGPGRPDPRGWEWYYLRSLGRGDLMTLRAHGDRVMTVAWSPDRDRLASGSRDKTVKVWSTATGEELLTLRGHGHFVQSVAWSPDGRRIASAGDDLSVRIWDASTGRGLLTLLGHRDRINAVAWSPDGRRVASAGEDGTARLWDPGTGRELLTLRGESAGIWSLAWSPDGRRIATGFNYLEDERVKIWDAEAGTLLQALPEAGSLNSELAWSPDGRRLAAASWDQMVRVWDTGSWEPLLGFRAHSGAVRSLCWDAGGTRLATGGEDGTVRIWDAGTGRELNLLRGHLGWVESVAWCPDGRLASAGDDQTAKVWDPGRTHDAFALDGRHTAAWSPDGRRLATPGMRGDRGQASLVIFDAATWKTTRNFPLADATASTCAAAWRPDGGRIAVAGGAGRVSVLDAETGRELLGFQSHGDKVRSVTWSPDGRMLAIAGDAKDRTVKLWEASTGEPIRTFRAEEGTYGAAVWSPDGRRLAMSIWGDHEFVEVWEAGTWERTHRLERGRPWSFGVDGHHGVAWSPRGDRLAAGNGKGEFTVWDAASGRPLVRGYGHSANIRSIAWCPDGRRIATLSEDRTVKIWHAGTGSELLTLQGHDGWNYSLAWSPDGRWLAAGGESLKVWEAPPE